MVRSKRNYQEDSRRVIDYLSERPNSRYEDVVSDFQKSGWEPEYTGSLISRLLTENIVKIDISIRPREAT